MMVVHHLDHLVPLGAVTDWRHARPTRPRPSRWSGHFPCWCGSASLRSSTSQAHHPPGLISTHPTLSMVSTTRRMSSTAPSLATDKMCTIDLKLRRWSSQTLTVIILLLVAACGYIGWQRPFLEGEEVTIIILVAACGHHWQRPFTEEKVTQLPPPAKRSDLTTALCLRIMKCWVIWNIE